MCLHIALFCIDNHFTIMGFMNFAHFVDLCKHEGLPIDHTIPMSWNDALQAAPWLIIDWNNVVMKLAVDYGGDLVALSIRCRAIFHALFSCGARLAVLKDGSHDLDRLIVKFDRAISDLNDRIDDGSPRTARPLESIRLAVSLASQLARGMLDDIHGEHMASDLEITPETLCLFKEVDGEADGAIRRFAQQRLSEGQRVYILSDDHSLLLGVSDQNLYFMRPASLFLKAVAADSAEAASEGMPEGCAAPGDDDMGTETDDLAVDLEHVHLEPSAAAEPAALESSNLVLHGTAVHIADFLLALTRRANKVCAAPINKKVCNHIPFACAMLPWISALFSGDLRKFRSRSYEDPIRLTWFMDIFFTGNGHKGMTVVTMAILVRAWFSACGDRGFGACIQEVVKAAHKLVSGQKASIFGLYSTNQDDKALRDAASSLLFVFESNVTKDRIQGKLARDSAVQCKYQGKFFPAKVVFVNNQSTAGVLYADPKTASDSTPCALANKDVQAAMALQVQRGYEELQDTPATGQLYWMIWGIWLHYEPKDASTEILLSPLYSLAYQLHYLHGLDDKVRALLPSGMLQASGGDWIAEQPFGLSIRSFFRSIHQLRLTNGLIAPKNGLQVKLSRTRGECQTMDEMYQNYVMNQRELAGQGAFAANKGETGLQWQVWEREDAWAIEHGLCLRNPHYNPSQKGCLFNLADRLAYFQQKVQRVGPASDESRTAELIHVLNLTADAVSPACAQIARLLEKLPGSAESKEFIFSSSSVKEVADLIFTCLFCAFKLLRLPPSCAIATICSMLLSPVFAAKSHQLVMESKLKVHGTQSAFEKSIRDQHKLLFNTAGNKQSDRHANLLELALSPLLKMAFHKQESEHAKFFHLTGVQSVLGRLETASGVQVEAIEVIKSLELGEEASVEFMSTVGMLFDTFLGLLA